MPHNPLDLQATAHRRRNPLTGEWVLVSPQRVERPWQGQTEAVAGARPPRYDPGCYLCPGNGRAGGATNPAYASTFVFDNDFAALQPGVPEARYAAGGLLEARSEAGRCRVICYSPRHDLALGRMAPADVRRVVDAWAGEYASLGSLPWVRAVTIFENRGAAMGASSPHPHGQLWASGTVPGALARESAGQADYLGAHGRCLLCDYAALEAAERTRVVAQNDECLAVVPFWATWPFETLVLPRRHVPAIDALEAPGRDGLARLLKELTQRYDALFDVEFPYTMGLHQRPTDGDAHPHWHLHAHFYPPLLRSATVRKFMVGYEMLADAQRDLTPEVAAARLRDAC
ncbi:MAG TPA: UDP-glucose--hexose-1-phosphate uridylyltransferase [Steroidobacteraceae bacterium]|nr:UDP-glucose--hexose-1-phosphate uridylyltransferase [Steroidobacteraceae bacterium]